MSLLTVKETAATLRMSERYVLDEIRRGNLRAAKFGRILRIDQADLDAYKTAHLNVLRTEHRPPRRRAS